MNISEHRGGALLDAEARIGEILKEAPPPKFKQNTDGYLEGTIGSLPEGITKKLSYQCQQLAEHPEIIEQVKADAEESYKGRIFDAVKGYQKRRKRCRIRNTPARCPTDRTFAIVGRESAPVERSGGLFSANQGKSNAG